MTTLYILSTVTGKPVRITPDYSLVESFYPNSEYTLYAVNADEPWVEVPPIEWEI
jgi:hypothetical protein